MSKIETKSFGSAPIDARVFLVAAGGMRVAEHRIVIINVPGGSILRKCIKEVVIPVADIEPSVHVFFEKLGSAPGVDGVRWQKAYKIICEVVQMLAKDLTER